MENCIFCAIADKKISPWLVMESETCIAFLDNNPVAQYHTLVIPKAHYTNILDVPEPVLKDVTELIHKVCQLYTQRLGIDSYQIFNNSGPKSAQTVYHLHFHILPRIDGDAITFYAKRMPELVQKYPEMLEALK